MRKMDRELLRLLQPLAAQAGATLSLDPRSKHPTILVTLNNNTRWVPFSPSHNIPEVTIYHTKKKVLAALRELTSGQTAANADPRKRH